MIIDLQGERILILPGWVDWVKHKLLCDDSKVFVSGLYVGLMCIEVSIQKAKGAVPQSESNGNTSFIRLNRLAVLSPQ